jgi:hypothetical protein
MEASCNKQKCTCLKTFLPGGKLRDGAVREKRTNKKHNPFCRVLFQYWTQGINFCHHHLQEDVGYRQHRRLITKIHSQAVNALLKNAM